MVKARWFAGKVVHKTKSTAEEVQKYYEDEEEIKTRIRKLKHGYKVDIKLKT